MIIIMQETWLSLQQPGFLSLCHSRLQPAIDLTERSLQQQLLREVASSPATSSSATMSVLRDPFKIIIHMYDGLHLPERLISGVEIAINDAFPTFSLQQKIQTSPKRWQVHDRYRVSTGPVRNDLLSGGKMADTAADRSSERTAPLYMSHEWPN